ncbi:LysR substrate-binding domain-containing protein [Stenotrophomonas sp. SY1]|uniref:LysR substrate-binding domain-containing protein n=1 Tax=Stenotrophomonas sp. SY1 TaxID=477235 RepID=UPI001E629BB2|nr:LysR substrate-binding domain-containing protein [Stenotrophomonas sp. SY1]MCD9087660.1 LysR substrate-binding domain-containing protein [Stenotrophomonas sp. SY1]
MIDLRLLRQFVAVAEELHFHRAAARLHMSQPPLTAAIRRLEASVGAELIVRGNRTLGLTAAGATLLAEARQTLLQAEQALLRTRDVAAGRSGRLRIAYVGSALYGRLPACIRAFRQSHPQVRLELREATSRQQQMMLRADAIDLGILIPPVPDAGELELRAFDHGGLAIAVPREHSLVAAGEMSVAALRDEAFVMWPAEEGIGFHSQVMALCRDAGFLPRVVQEAHGMHAVLSLVAVGAGVAIVPASMAGFRSEDIRYQWINATGAGFELQFCLRPAHGNPALREWLRGCDQR